MTTSPAELQRKVQQLDNDVQSIYELLSGIEGTQRRHSNRFTEVAAQISGLEEQVSLLAEQTGTLDGKVDALDGKVDALGGKVDALDGKVDALDARLDEILRLLLGEGPVERP